MESIVCEPMGRIEVKGYRLDGRSRQNGTLSLIVIYASRPYRSLRTRLRGKKVNQIGPCEYSSQFE